MEEEGTEGRHLYLRGYAAAVMLGGKAVKLPTLPEIIDYANRQMETLWPEYTRLVNPNVMEINLSDKLQDLKSHIIEEDLKKK